MSSSFDVISYIVRLSKNYLFKSNHRLFAWCHLLAMLAFIPAFTILYSKLYQAMELAITGLALQSWSLFIPHLYPFMVISALLVASHYCFNLLNSRLKSNWKAWFNKYMIDKYMPEQLKSPENSSLDVSIEPFLRIKREHHDLNTLQILSNDLAAIVDMTLDLMIETLASSSKIFSSASYLWTIGGSLSFSILGIYGYIPGYLLWCSGLSSVIYTMISKEIGKPMLALEQQVISAKNDRIHCLETISHHTENIGLEHSAPYYKNQLLDLGQTINQQTKQYEYQSNQFSTFSQFFDFTKDILAYLCYAPIFFCNRLSLSNVYPLHNAFSNVYNNINSLSFKYNEMVNYSNRIKRVMQLDQVLTHPKPLPLELKQALSIVRDQHCQDLKIEQLKLYKPDGRPLANLEQPIIFKQGQDTILKAHNGFGKSTLFKAISGNWPYAEGFISLPDCKIRFSPQVVTIPRGDLRDVLCFPEANKNPAYDNMSLLKQILKQVGLEHYQEQMMDSKDWHNLSGGEKQKIELARILINRPDWLFLDESTSALDAKNEDLFFNIIKKQLPHTTIVMIGHHDGLYKRFERILELSPPCKINLARQGFFANEEPAATPPTHLVAHSCCQ